MPPAIYINIVLIEFIGDGMANVCVSVPDDLKKQMEAFPEINWSEVARHAFSDKIADFQFLLEFRSKSTLSEKDAARLGKGVNDAVAARLHSAERAAKRKGAA